MPPTTLSALNPSPKRKRDPLHHVAPLAPLNPSTPPPDLPAASGSESPRNRVADQLRDLTIMHPVSTLRLVEEPAEAVVRKKAKRDHLPDALAQSEEARDWQDEWATATATHSWATDETPTNSNTIPDTIVDNPYPTERQNGPSGTRSRKKSPSPPPMFSSLTWQDSEITGHLADPSIDPEDDGTGLNGIGFRPTPALAYARAQRRRQQVLEWRTREAREARQKRYEQRKRGSSSVRSGLDESKEGRRRTVRFVA